MVTFVYYFIACSSTIAIAVYLFTISTTNDIIENLHLINEAAKSDEIESNLLIPISKFIDYHSILKELSQYVLLHIIMPQSIINVESTFQINCRYFKSISAKERDSAFVQYCTFGLYNAHNSNSKWPNL